MDKVQKHNSFSIKENTNMKRLLKCGCWLLVALDEMNGFINMSTGFHFVVYISGMVLYLIEGYIKKN
jgi:hypothetical protein